jgi:taurine dioxygenase
MSGLVVTPITPVFGAFIRGVDLNHPVAETVVDHIRKLVHQHRLLIFKEQGTVSAEQQLVTSQWFGEVESTFYKHPRSPHPEIFRVSNDEASE